jgi:urease accessory protein
LETLVQEGTVRDRATLRSYIELMLNDVWGPFDALAVAAAHRYAAQGDWATLWRLDETMQAARAGSEARLALAKMGRQLLRLGRSLYPELPWEPLARAMSEGQCPGTYPLVYGYLTSALAIEPQIAVEGYLYAGALAAANNAVRLCAVGPTEAQIVLAGLLPGIPALSLTAVARDPFDFAAGAPAAEIAMLRHETLYSRLFMS